ncbi:MAG: hypothetical protein QXE01_08240 [Sulfolobales archaeon]
MKARVKIIFYKEEKSSIGPVEFTSLRAIGEKVFEEPLELGENPEEALEKLARDAGDGDYVEAIAEMKDGIIRVGVSRKEGVDTQGSHILFYRPSKLLKIGVVRRNRASVDTLQKDRELPIPEESDEASKNTSSQHVEEINTIGTNTAQAGGALSEDNIVWYTPSTTIYVFEGYVRVNEPYEAVIFLTEDGEKIYMGSEGSSEKRVIRRAKRVRRKRKKKK